MCVCVCLFRATPAACGSSQARGQIRAVATILCHSHSNTGSKSAIYTTAHSNAGSLTHWATPEIEPTSSWILVGFVTNEPQWELLDTQILNNILENRIQQMGFVSRSQTESTLKKSISLICRINRLKKKKSQAHISSSPKKAFL